MSERRLEDTFMASLTNGVLTPILVRVQNDLTLDLQIRDNFINIYYRGGSLSRITQNGPNDYIVNFDTKYFSDVGLNSSIDFPYTIHQISDSYGLLKGFPQLKEAMDLFQAKHPKEEREFQQLVVRDNNYSSISNSTDYIICDIEYTHSDHLELRFDMIGAYWPSNASARKKPEILKIALIEMKYGDGALTGAAGIQKHLRDLCKSTDLMENIRGEITKVTQQKARLGLIKKSEIDKVDRYSKLSFSNSANLKPEWILILADHDPQSSVLKRELKILAEAINNESDFPFDVKIATSSFMGYGLYEQFILPVNELWF